MGRGKQLDEKTGGTRVMTGQSLADRQSGIHALARPELWWLTEFAAEGNRGHNERHLHVSRARSSAENVDEADQLCSQILCAR